jgi:GDP-6-deoxy-D-talose 4-dehydrogenase
MKILVTGARGFTGRHFIRAAQAAGHSAVPLDCDLTQAEAVAAQVDALDFDSVVHLAGIAFVGHADDRAFYDVNLFGTLNLLEAVHRRGKPLRKVLVASSANVYGNCEQSPIPESQPPSPVNHYAMSKLAMECMARARFGSLPLVMTRPFNYTGPGQSPDFLVPKLVDHFVRRAPVVKLGNLDVRREYNDVRFLCDAYFRLLDSSAFGTFNVCSSRTYSIRELVAELSRLSNHTIEIEVDPALVRRNEIHELSGDPSRLVEAVGQPATHPIEDTLSWMLDEARAQSDSKRAH